VVAVELPIVVSVSAFAIRKQPLIAKMHANFLNI
jgi:hypothetical protein